MAQQGTGMGWKILTIANTISDVLGGFVKIKDIPIPEVLKQQLPKWFGLTLDDERIFNGVLALLTAKQQKIITEFLQKKCKSYERNRFINIVAGMEVSTGTPGEKEIKIDKDGNQTEKTKPGSPDMDRRQKFLESFADIITNDFGGDLDKAYEYCIGGRMILEDPFSQQALRAFSDSVKMLRRIVSPKATGGALGPARAVSASVQKFADDSEAEYRKRLWWKDIPVVSPFFSKIPKIGGFFK